MIAYLKGEILKKGVEDRYCWVDLITNGGVGYRVIVPSNIEINDSSCELFTSFQVREDSQVLYGFTDALDRDFFELLITVSGVGPKLGVAIMSAYRSNQIKSFIIKGDHEALSKVSGLGKKGSQKIVVELENKIKDLGLVEEFSSSSGIVKELKVALQSLGFSGEGLSAYLKAAEEIVKEDSEILLEDLIKLVLQSD